jgi:hypothetical protein
LADAGIGIVADVIVVVIGCAASVAYAQGIVAPNAGVGVIAQAIAVCICFTGSSACAKGIGLVSIAVAIPFGVI